MTLFTAFGPQGPNYATSRPPADPKASAGVDTFFKNCSAAGAKDGTFATADFFNVTLANLRYLCRTAGVVLDDADDTMVYQAVQDLIAAAIAGIGGPGGDPTLGPVLPKTRINASPVAALAFGTYTPQGLAIASSAGLTPTISAGTLSFTLPAGTYLIVTRCNTRIKVNNSTEIVQIAAVSKNGAVVSQSFEASYLIAGADMNVDHTVTCLVQVAPTDLLSLNAYAATTFIADFNLAQANAGYFDVVYLGP